MFCFICYHYHYVCSVFSFNYYEILSFSSILQCVCIRNLTKPSLHQVYPEKLQNIVSDISKLTLIEVADLNELLKKTLNIPDAPVMAFGAPMGAPAAAKVCPPVCVCVCVCGLGKLWW